MPIFEYLCNDCQHKFEELVSSSTKEIPCPKCGSSKTSKLLSVFAASAGSSGSSAMPSCGSSRCGSGFS